MTEQRPTLARKHTRGSEEKRKADFEIGVKITCDGEVYELRRGDLNGKTERLLRAEYGKSFNGFMSDFSSDPGFDTIAVFVWLCRVVRGEEVTLDEVSEEVGFDFVQDMKIETAKPEEVAPGE